MRFAGALVFLAGYTIAWWGWERLGGPVDLLDLIVPGRSGTFQSSHTRGRSGPPGAIPTPPKAASGPLPGLGGAVPYGAPGFPAAPPVGGGHN